MVVVVVVNALDMVRGIAEVWSMKSETEAVAEPDGEAETLWMWNCLHRLVMGFSLQLATISVPKAW